jgi:hypothetical protein
MPVHTTQGEIAQSLIRLNCQCVVAVVVGGNFGGPSESLRLLSLFKLTGPISYQTARVTWWLCGSLANRHEISEEFPSTASNKNRIKTNLLGTNYALHFPPTALFVDFII